MLLKARNAEEGVHIEIMPLIDMVFLLLIFFLVATTFQQTEREMQIALPFAQASGPISASLREIIVNVDRDGKFVVSGRTLSADDLQALVAEAVKANPEQKVTIRGDRHADYGDVVVALDVCKGAGIQEPYLDTVLE